MTIGWQPVRPNETGYNASSHAVHGSGVLTGQRPADVRVLRRNYIEGVALGVKQQKTHKKLRALLEVDGVERSLVAMISIILAQNEQ